MKMNLQQSVVVREPYEKSCTSPETGVSYGYVLWFEKRAVFRQYYAHVGLGFKKITHIIHNIYFMNVSLASALWCSWS